MVSPSKPNHSRVASQHHLHKCKLVKGPKPLTHFKFYLDIEKHHIENKIEKTIRELGGSIEFFLAKTVTHFVTDKAIDRDGNLLNVSSSQHLSPSPLFVSQSPSPAQKSASHQSLLFLDLNDSGTSHELSNDERAACSKPKSRADAMVQRARTAQQQSIAFDNRNVRCASTQQAGITSQNPVQLAQTWGTPIWTTEYTLKFLEKVTLALKLDSPSAATSRDKTSKSSAIAAATPHHHHHHSHHHHHHQHKTANAKHLNGDYIKIESTQKHYRPYYQELAQWPQLNFNCTLCPFQAKSDKSVTQTNKYNKKPQNNLNSETLDEFLKNKLTTATKATVADRSVQSTVSVLAKNHIQNLIENTMTRKTRNKQVRDPHADACTIKTNADGVKQNSEKCGYCEKCRVEYDVLSLHLQSKEHLSFVKNADNYLALDNLINSGTNVEQFIRINTAGSPPKKQNGDLRLRSLLMGQDQGLTNGADESLVKSHKQMNGTVHRDEQLSPKLPKYSPPITRRSQTKQTVEQSKNGGRPNAINCTPKLTDAATEALAEDDVTSVRARRETMKRINYTEPKEDEENLIEDVKMGNKITINGKKKCEDAAITPAINDESPVLPKRLIRAFPRYKVIDGDDHQTSEKTTKTTKSNSIAVNPDEDSLSTDNFDEHQNRDPITGLIVKFKRVRESELSKLTFEADNFMFPKQRDDVLTDDDRQSTSERCTGDVSTELLSSDIGSPALSTTHNASHNISATSEQFTSSGRRKKRSTQFDSSFKSAPEKKQKFRASSIQSRLSAGKVAATTAAAATTATGAQTPAKKTRQRRSAKLSTAKVGRPSTKASSSTGKDETGAANSSTAANSGDSQLDDRMGENSYNGGKLLATDYFQNLKFSFERVPYNEPWYLTFQRQDEHRERVFEYWGNTAYRKLPYELGPLPPLRSDCCFLSRLAAMKAPKQQKSKRSLKANRMKFERHGDDEATSKKGESVEDDEHGTFQSSENVDTTTIATSTAATRSKPKTESSTVTSSSGSSSCTKAPSTSQALNSALSALENSKTDKKTHSTLSQLLLADSSLNSISLPAAIAGKKKTMLLDAFGQPRKSPREHASTLAILSSLVQQRRKRFKELNGISPEKMPSYKAALAQHQQSSAEISENDDTEDIVEDDDDSYQMKSVVDAPHFTYSNRRRSNQTPVFEKNASDAATTEPNPIAHSSTEQSDKIFRLRKGKRRQTESVSSNNESVIGKNDHPTTATEKESEATQPPAAKESLKMPVDDYVDPNKVVRQLDDLLSSCLSEDGVDSADIDEMPIDSDSNYSDLILVNTEKDFVEIVSTVKEGPLSYRSVVNVNKRSGLSSFARGKKRHINKTGWPSLPRKRIKREKTEEMEETTIIGAQSNTDDDDDDDESTANICDRDRIDISSKLMQHKNDEFLIHARNVIKKEATNCETDDADDADDDDDEVVSHTNIRSDRRSIRTPFCNENDNDNAVNNVFASSSEKAENSDIFTVSSDSLDTTDLHNESITTVKSPMSANSNTTDAASLHDVDDKSMSDDTTADDEIISVPTKPTSILERTLTNMATRSQYLRSPIGKDALNLKELQPMVCVQKMSEKDFYRRTYGKSFVSPPTTPQKIHTPNRSPARSPAQSPPVHETNNCKPKANSRASASPKSKVSPRKLRKPRGRFYRER